VPPDLKPERVLENLGRASFPKKLKWRLVDSDQMAEGVEWLFDSIHRCFHKVGKQDASTKKKGFQIGFPSLAFG
jgi:hypothetical protein